MTLNIMEQVTYFKRFPHQLLKSQDLLTTCRNVKTSSIDNFFSYVPWDLGLDVRL